MDIGTEQGRHEPSRALVAAIAIVGRGLILALLIHYGTAQAGTAPVMAAIVMIVVTAAMLVWAFDIARHGQSTSSSVPDDAGFSITSARSSGSADAAVTARAPDGRRDPVPSALSIPQEPPPNCENRY